ncbi:winged helix-turn-helix domain-containing protein [Methylophaga sp. OBS1]|uniref:winged helix-turn-helix domain-containing protein n=1 Tax=Methylophaga sp. OBS1 TaxID=2991933 RepID=UPI00225C1D4F|nr:winged helix-turn-helix domain-containing protein [Methylophaga sp. OBS1]MCX4193077.1 winged helix-turn-helix domain-containing protein [Methylophaga sp. OBS1]
MTDTIGAAAGIIWHYLAENGAVSVSKLAKDTGLESKVLQRALGWLAKEDKLCFELKGRSEMISLKQG